MSLIYPEWAKTREQFDAAVANRRAPLEEYLRARVQRRNGPQAVLFISGKYAGKTLAEVAALLGKPYEKVLIDDFGYGGPDAAHFVMSAAVQDQFIADEHIAVCTDGSPTMGHPRSAGAFAKILEEHVGTSPKMSLEFAIHKMSALPAEILGIDRGLIAPGKKSRYIDSRPGADS